MRYVMIALAALFLLAPLAGLAAALAVTDPNMEVDSIALVPGEAVVFGFGEGFDHQLLLVRHRGAEAVSAALDVDEVRAALYADEGETWLEIENGTGETLYFDALADRSGNGGYGPVPTAAVAAGMRAVAGRWGFAFASLVIGEFSYGPHGDHAH